jgi:hypothetical protein
MAQTMYTHVSKCKNDKKKIHPPKKILELRIVWEKRKSSGKPMKSICSGSRLR